MIANNCATVAAFYGQKKQIGVNIYIAYT